MSSGTSGCKPRPGGGVLHSLRCVHAVHTHGCYADPKSPKVPCDFRSCIRYAWSVTEEGIVFWTDVHGPMCPGGAECGIAKSAWDIAPGGRAVESHAEFLRLAGYA